jgi:hypothetical protein
MCLCCIIYVTDSKETNATEKSPPSEANSHSASQEFLPFIEPKVYYRVHKESAACPYDEPDASNPQLPNLFL